MCVCFSNFDERKVNILHQFFSMEVQHCMVLIVNVSLCFDPSVNANDMIVGAAKTHLIYQEYFVPCPEAYG